MSCLLCLYYHRLFCTKTVTKHYLYNHQNIYLGAKEISKSHVQYFLIYTKFVWLAFRYKPINFFFVKNAKEQKKSKT